MINGIDFFPVSSTIKDFEILLKNVVQSIDQACKEWEGDLATVFTIPWGFQR